MDANQTELHATETLLQRGVRVRVRAPLLLRLLFIKVITFTLREPTGGAYARMGEWFLKCQLSIDKLEQIAVEDALLFNVKYGGNIYRALACLFISNKLLTWLFLKPVSYWLKEGLPNRDTLTLLEMVIVHGGIKDFMTTTRYIRGVMITPPNLGQKTKRS